jgi:hypothetical protein
MLRAPRYVGLRGAHRRRSVIVSPFGSSASSGFPQVNPRVELDPALRDLLRDVDMSLGGKKRRRGGPHPVLKRELEHFPELQQVTSVTTSDPGDLDLEAQDEDVVGRKSPAADFGSQGIGAVVLPLELQNSINLIISGANILLYTNRLLKRDIQREINGNYTVTPSVYSRNKTTPSASKIVGTQTMTRNTARRVKLAGIPIATDLLLPP